jgi:Secretion system C-terminal sorting domain
LQQVDRDGKTELSKVVSVSNAGDKQEVKIYPNPTHRLLTLEHATTTKSFDVLNALGQNVKTIHTKPESIQTIIPTHDLDNGIYFLRIRSTNGLDKLTQTIRFVKL